MHKLLSYLVLNALELWFMVLLLINFIVCLPYSVSDYHTSINIVTTLENVLCFSTYCIILLYHGYGYKIVMYWNFKLVPYNEVSNAAKVITIKHKAISAFTAGLTVIFSQGNYSADVCLTYFYGNTISGGVFDGIAFIFSDAPVGRTSIVIKNSEFNHNVMSSGKQAFFGIGIIVTKVKSSNDHTLNVPWNIITISDSTMYDRHYIRYTDNELGFSSKLNLYNHSAFHVITASNVISNITIRIFNFKYIQSFTGIRNSFIFSETTKGQKNVQFILESVTLIQAFFTAIETTLNTGKLVFINTASVYINGINDFSEMTGSVIQAYNSDIHLNGSARFNDNNASHKHNYYQN